MRRIVPFVVVLALQPLVLVLPTVADAFDAAPRPVAPTVTRLPVTGVAKTALTLETRAGRAPAAGTDLRVAVLTDPLPTSRFAVAGLTWTGATPPGTQIAVRVREGGTWGAWTPVPADDDGPDAGTAEAGRGRNGTDPVLTGGAADGVQVKVLSRTGAAPTGLDVTLVDPGTSPADGVVGTTSGASAQAAGTRPRILPRRAWGADESLRKDPPTYVDDVRAGVLHHTAGSNGYSAASVPAQIRGIYAYHTRGRGWNDIGYNVLVDRFGRAWEGRWGGLDHGVQGAHTLGFNSQTFGVSAMGNYETATPSPAMLTAIAKVFAWKFSVHRIDPRGTALLTSLGSPRYAEGRRVRVPTTTAHRTLGWTACPGRTLFARLPALRDRVAALVGAETLAPAVTPRTAVAGGPGRVRVSARFTLRQSWTVTVTGACSTTPYWSRTGTGRAVDLTWPLTKTSGRPVAPGAYLVTLTSRTTRSTATPYRAWVEVLPTATAALGPCPAVRLAPRTAASVAEGTRRLDGPSTTLVVVPEDPAHRRESVGAGALAAALDARLVSSPGRTLSRAVLDRIARDGVTQVVLVGRDGAWSGGVAAQLAPSGATLTTVAGPSRTAVLVASARRAAAGRTVRTAVLVDPGDVVPAAAAASAAAARGAVVLPVAPTGAPAATTSALADLGITRVVLAGRGGPGPAATAALAAAHDLVDLRATTRDGATARIAGWVPRAGWSVTGVVSADGSDGLEAVLASALGRPLLLTGPAGPGPGARAALAQRRTAVRRVAVAAGTAVVPTAVLAGFSAAVTGTTSPAASAGHAAGVTTRRPLAPASAPPPPAAFTVTGAGFGHGAGMSQYGAYALAKAGATYGRILATYYPGTRLGTVDDDRRIRVNLLHQAASAAFSVVPAPGEDGPVAMRLVTGRGTTTLAVGDGASVVPGASGGLEVWRDGRRVLTTPGRVHVIWTGTGDWQGNAALGRLSGTGTEGTKTRRGYRYGEMWVHRVGARLEVVGETGLGQYVRGLAEMPASWGTTGPAALRAQAVAARTFAWRKVLRGVREECRCHVYDSTRDQAYGGYQAEAGFYGPHWRAAVVRTRGRILTYRGTPAEALYYSSSGGRTQDVAEVFGTAVPYLVSVADPYSLDPAVANPYASWDRTVSQAALRRVFDDLADVVAVRVTVRTAGRAAKTVRATSSSGATQDVTGTVFRRGLGLPATWVRSVRPA